MRGVKLTVVFLISIFFVAPDVQAQKKSKSQLQKEKQERLQKINEVERILTETSTKKKNSLGELTALNQRVKAQENLVESIRAEVTALDEEINENNDIISVLEKDLQRLKDEYAAMLFAAQKANNSATRLMFLFSAKDFDQLAMRLRFMEQYGKTRRLQTEQIVKVQDELSGQVLSIQQRRDEKNKLLSEQLKESNQLSDLKRKQNDLVKSLEKQEKSLRRDLDETKKAVARLDKLIEDIVKAEMSRNVRNTSSEVALSSSFEDNKTKFPWPVSAGFVSLKFGRQSHPVLKGIVLQNNGVNIQTKENETVKSVFAGEVRAVAFIQSMGSTVIIKHGDYLTVYAGLKEVFVRTGQKVTTHQEIGKVFSNSDGVSELRFQIFKNTTALDPQAWLRNM